VVAVLEEAMTDKEARQRLDARIRRMLQLGWQLVERTTDPPRAVVEYRQSLSRRGPGTRSEQENRRSDQRLVMWIDDAETLREEKTDLTPGSSRHAEHRTDFSSKRGSRSENPLRRTKTDHRTAAQAPGFVFREPQPRRTPWWRRWWPWS
jgi:hypothetical protein